MTNRIIYLDDETLTAQEQRQAFWAQLAQDFPIDFSIVQSVVYHDKTDRYVAKGAAGSVKLMPEVAAFLLAQAKPGVKYGPVPTVRMKMEDGTITAVALLFLSREGGR